MRTELVTTLKRRATELLDQLQENREPILVTQHGLPAAVMIDIESYQKLERRLAILEGIARGERAVDEGRLVPHSKARARLARWLR